ncbi:hypothetical protein B0J17DRAFT_658598 [Rhizoctonia solani]|nr:hypothetical protein B0J17DRAFT_658598 [Rhizoctonia solani]
MLPAPAHDDFWHPSIEKVPELITNYMNHPGMYASIDRIEICLALRNFRDTTKRLHWCLLFIQRPVITAPFSLDRRVDLMVKEEAWLVNPCSRLAGNGEGFLHYLNTDALAARRLTLRTVAILSCLVSPNSCWLVGNVLPTITLNPKRELLCCSVIRSCSEESHIVDSTHMWVLAILRALPCFDFDPMKAGPSNRFKKAVELADKEMWRVSGGELHELAREH